MPSLKEVKNRISTVKTTRKITQARQMVSSAQLHRAQGMLERARAYRDGLTALAAKVPAASPLGEVREKGAVGVVIAASNGGMCGSFNARMEREIARVADAFRGRKLSFYPVGRKIREAVVRAGFEPAGDFDALAAKPSSEGSDALAARLIEAFASGALAQVEVVFYDFQTIGRQEIVQQTLLPLPAPQTDTEAETDDEYIVEPSPAELAGVLLPMVVRADLWAALASNAASEHAARTIAMQLATENADELLDELQLSYNKLRQQNITAELLDIIGSSFA